MAFTLEATLVIPMTMAITVGILSASIHLYGNIEKDAALESESFIYALENKDLWSCKINNNSFGYNINDEINHNEIINNNSNSNINNIRDHSNNFGWSKMISVNPMKEKMFLSFAIDTINEIKEFVPIFNEVEGLFYENKKQ